MKKKFGWCFFIAVLFVVSLTLLIISKKEAKPIYDIGLSEQQLENIYRGKRMTSWLEKNHKEVLKKIHIDDGGKIYVNKELVLSDYQALEQLLYNDVLIIMAIDSKFDLDFFQKLHQPDYVMITICPNAVLENEMIFDNTKSLQLFGVRPQDIKKISSGKSLRGFRISFVEPTIFDFNMLSQMSNLRNVDLNNISDFNENCINILKHPIKYRITGFESSKMDRKIEFLKKYFNVEYAYSREDDMHIIELK